MPGHDESREALLTELEELRALAAHYRTYVDRGPHAIVVADETGRLVDANPAACRLTGYTREELLERSIADLALDQSNRDHFAILKREGSLSVERPLPRKDGSVRQITLDAVSLPPGQYMAFITDVTELREKENALRQEHERAQRVLDTVEAIIVSLDREGRITLINRKGCDILGYAEHELLGRSWFDTCIPEPERDEVRTFFRRIMGGEVESAVAHYSNAVLTRDGALREIAWHNRTLRDDTGKPTGTLSAGHDITDQKKLEAQVLQTQKLEAMGTLAGGIAHDMNNVLAIIVAFASVVERQVPATHPARTNIESIMVAANRGKSLVANLLGFARKGHFEKRLVGIDAIVESLAGVLEPLLPKKVALKTDLAGDLGPVYVDDDQVAQVLVNLCLNAADAMNQEGTITITTRSVALGSGEMPELVAGRYVRIDVQDTGSGMSEEVLARAFEPFFTTKDVGRGTGLGLSMAYGVIRKHRGTIAITSRPGAGTQVSLWLPLAGPAERRAAESAAKRPETFATAHRPEGESKGTILLIDDEDLLREGLTRLLTHFGYAVIDTGDAKRALEIFRERGSEIDLVLLDMSMPGMDGLDCLGELRELDPEVRVIICTGHGKDGAIEEALRRGSVAALRKPVAPEQLDAVVRRALGTTGAEPS